MRSRAWFNINMLSYQYRKYHCGDKMVVRSSYLHNGISYTGKMTSLYGIRAQALFQYNDHLFRYRHFHCKDKIIMRPSYFHNRNPYTCMAVSLYWDSLLMTSGARPTSGTILTHWDKMATILPFSNPFHCMVFVFLFKCRCNMFLKVLLTIIHHWFR